jgi:hypothetical protein
VAGEVNLGSRGRDTPFTSEHRPWGAFAPGREASDPPADGAATRWPAADVHAHLSGSTPQLVLLVGALGAAAVLRPTVALASLPSRCRRSCLAIV